MEIVGRGRKKLFIFGLGAGGGRAIESHPRERNQRLDLSVEVYKSRRDVSRIRYLTGIKESEISSLSSGAGSADTGETELR